MVQAAGSAVPEPEPADPDAGDALLVARARERDTRAFRQLVERHQDRAYSLALRMVRSPADAQEVAQDAFARAWRALPGFRGDARFSTWLHAIVVRLAIDRAAILDRRRRREVDLDDAASVSGSAGHDPERAVRVARLERLVRTLPETQRAVVTLYYHEDRSVDDVAALLGMPVGTVKTHLSRARAALREGWLSEERKA